MDQTEQREGAGGPGMKKLLTISMVFFLFGCHAAVYREIRNQPTGQRTDVFREISNDSEVPAGSAGLLIKAEMKTHHKDFYILESRKSFHGKPQYPIVINIDGQQVTLEMPGVRDDTPMYDDRGEVLPEGGKGMKYTIEKKIALAPGHHHLAVIIPGDSYIKEMEITLPAESHNTLDLKPVYAIGGIGRHQNFLHGIKSLDAILNGQTLR
jgi:hypothetical protein